MVDPGEERIATTLGFSRRSMRRAQVVAFMALVVSLVSVSFALWRVWYQPPVIPYVVVLDQDTKVVNTIRAHPFEATDAVYADIARRWIVGIRSRSPVDPLTNQVRNEAKRLTDQRAYRQIVEMMRQQDGELKEHEGIEIGIQEMTLGPIAHQTDGKTGQVIITVKVDWRERKYRENGGEGKWVPLYAYVAMVEKPQGTTGEFEANPLHIYVIGCSFGAGYIEAPKQPNARVSEAQ